MLSIEAQIMRDVLEPNLNADMLRPMLNDFLRTQTVEQREASTAQAVAAVNAALGRVGIPALPPVAGEQETRMQKHLEEMRRDGITLLGPVLSPQQVAQIHANLASKNVYASHVWTFSDRVSKPRDTVKQTHKQCCYRLDDVLGAPHLLETMTDPFILKVIEQYLGCVPTLYQSNLMWSFQKSDGAPAVAQSYHRDWDNFRFCVLFIYLTNVDDNTGPHRYIRHSHDSKSVRDLLAQWHHKGGDSSISLNQLFQVSQMVPEEKLIDIFKNEVMEIKQPAGYAFLADAFGLHRGMPLLQGERLLCWSRYGLYDNGFSVDVAPGPLEPAPFKGRVQDDKTHRYICRSILRSEFTDAPTRSLHPGYDLPKAEAKTASVEPLARAKSLLLRVPRKLKRTAASLLKTG